MRYTVQYDTETDRWYTEDRLGRGSSLHCGEAFLIQMGEMFVMAHLELDSEWYVRIENIKFWLHRNETYTIKYVF